MEGGLQQTTVAAPATPILRESVNAVPQNTIAAKVGNATSVHIAREAAAYREAILAGAIVGAPAAPEVLG